jgi:L-lactate dehydrogenase
MMFVMKPKVGIVGSGFVGSTTAYALLMQGIGREIVLVDRSSARSVAEAEDILHAVPFSNPLSVRAGEYSDLVDCRVVVVAAGVNQAPGETRLELLQRNAGVFHDIIPKILQYAPNAILLIATNPVDILTHIASEIALRCGIPTSRVIGSGTTLDTARLRTLLGAHFAVDSRHVHAYVIGEHGDSEVLTWSLATIGGLSLDEFSQARSVTFDEKIRETIDTKVRRAAYRIIEGKGATYYGIGSALARIVSVILHDQRSIMTVCSRMNEVETLRDVTISLPQLIGGDGVLGVVTLKLNESERVGLQNSASIIKSAIEKITLPK